VTLTDILVNTAFSLGTIKQSIH